MNPVGLRSTPVEDSLSLRYRGYLALDEDRNGLLSKAELLHFRGPRGDARLTAAFVDRVFAEVMTYGGEMDYKTWAAA